LLLAHGGAFLIRNGTNCLVFVEVKTRSSEEWVRPAAAVDADKRRHLSLAALDYLWRLGNPQIKIRFDIAEVLHEKKTALLLHGLRSIGKQREKQPPGLQTRLRG
jgi:Holliday junction resolvase-like predicted endonuclease